MPAPSRSGIPQEGRRMLDLDAVFSDRRIPVERLAEPAEQALEMADRLARPA